MAKFDAVFDKGILGPLRSHPRFMPNDALLLKDASEGASAAIGEGKIHLFRVHGRFQIKVEDISVQGVEISMSEDGDLIVSVETK